MKKFLFIIILLMCASFDFSQGHFFLGLSAQTTHDLIAKDGRIVARKFESGDSLIARGVMFNDQLNLRQNIQVFEKGGKPEKFVLSKKIYYEGFRRKVVRKEGTFIYDSSKREILLITPPIRVIESRGKGIAGEFVVIFVVVFFLSLSAMFFVKGDFYLVALFLFFITVLLSSFKAFSGGIDTLVIFNAFFIVGFLLAAFIFKEDLPPKSNFTLLWVCAGGALIAYFMMESIMLSLTIIVASLVGASLGFVLRGPEKEEEHEEDALLEEG
ncbi:hypothetical protein B6U91_01415 [Candidatus Pacearchaeota archaeon ex4484_71]|nr:MAG: hypothetical protein B6U91_01415 [Candidatus Pacearchaeota archaeon ex4484_71]